MPAIHALDHPYPLDPTSRLMDPQQRGAIRESTPCLPKSLSLEPDEYSSSIATLRAPFLRMVGVPALRLPFNLQDYLDLLDSTGRVVHPTKRGTIPDTTPRLLATLGLAPNEWMKSVADLHVRFRLFIGAPHRLSSLAERRGWRWIRGLSAARILYQRACE